jgi:hypothetical protein
MMCAAPMPGRAHASVRKGVIVTYFALVMAKCKVNDKPGSFTGT